MFLDIADLMQALAAQRPIFHSEADFQHAFAWEIHQRLPSADVRLERPFLTDRGIAHLDLWATYEGHHIAVELKYKKHGLTTQLDDEEFILAHDGAHLLGRYDFIKDITRLERVVRDRQDVTGYAIFLTNEPAYWTGGSVVLPGKRTPLDIAFRLADGRTLPSHMAWDSRARPGMIKGKEPVLELTGTYALHWMDYSQLPDVASYARLRYLALTVTPSAT